MNKKISLGVSLTLILLSIAATFTITMTIAQNIYNRIIPDMEQRMQQNEALEDVAQKVIQNFYYIDRLDKVAQISALTNGYMDGLNDAGSYYMTAPEYELYLERMQGKRPGIGVNAVFQEDAGQLILSTVSPSSPAEKSGLKKGDVIVKIDNQAVTAENYTELEKKLSGKLLTSVKLSYQRGGIEKTVSVMHGYTHQSVSSEMIGQIAYIKINAFYMNTVKDFQNAVDKAMKQNAKAIIFDLRGTADGELQYAAQMIDYLVPLPTEGSKAIATLLKQDETVLETFSSDASSLSLSSIAVLVNGETSGLAELFACDLRDFGKAVLVGETTQGNGSYQKDYRLQEGGAILLTVAMIKPYTSPIFHEVGLTPDFVVSLTDEQKENFDLLDKKDDTQFQTALRLFQEQAEE